MISGDHNTRGRETVQITIYTTETILSIFATYIYCRPSNSHGLTTRLMVWDANSQSPGFAS